MAVGEPEGAAPSEEAVQQHAKCPYVGGRSGGLAADLLGCRVIGRERPLGAGCLAVGGRVEQAGDAEVEQLRLQAAVRLARDEDVGRLEVAVGDEAAVCVGDGVADLQKQLQPGVDAQPLAVGRVGDGRAVDGLEGEVGLAGGRLAAVEQARDGRVLEPGEDGALAQEPLANTRPGERRVGANELERDGLREAAVGSLGEVDAPHAAAAQLVHDAVRPDAGSRLKPVVRPHDASRELEVWRLRKDRREPERPVHHARPVVDSQQGLDFRPQRGVRARRGEVAGAVGRGEGSGGFKETLGVGPAVRAHRGTAVQYSEERQRRAGRPATGS